MNQRVILSVIFLGFLSACAQRETRTSKAEANVSSQIPVPPVPPEAENLGDGKARDAEILETKPESPNLGGDNTETPKKHFAVWIDSLGVDAFAALGFLQEMSKKNLKPVKVVGSGMGCWIAQSWAVAGSANRAEWQAMKWNDWKSLNASLIGRWSGSPSEDFESGIQKLSPVKSWSAFSVKTDCAVVPKNPPFHFSSAQDLKPEFAFWISMQQSALGVPESQMNLFPFYSGALGGAAREDELEEFSQDLLQNNPENFSGWIILSSRGIFVEDVGAKEPVRSLLSGRDFEWPKVIKGRATSPNSSGSNPKVLLLNLAPRTKRDTAALISPENRRRYLLEGRKAAGALMQSDEFLEFLK